MMSGKTSSLSPDQKREAEDIERIYKIFLDKMKLLEKKQMDVIGDFRKELERRKMEIVRKKLDLA